MLRIVLRVHVAGKYTTTHYCSLNNTDDKEENEQQYIYYKLLNIRSLKKQTETSFVMLEVFS